MTDTQLQALRAGGLAAFQGGSNPFRAGLTGAALSGLIEELTHSKLSHVGLVPPAVYWPAPSTPCLIESTIWGKTSGPQCNNLWSRLELDYAAKGGHAWLYPLLPQFAPDWPALWDAAQQLFARVRIGQLHYSVKRLFADATERNLAFAVLPVAGILAQLGEHDSGLVCSECAGLLLQAGGVDARAKAAGVPWLPKVEPVAGQPIGCAPEDLVEMPLYAAPVTLL